MRALTCELLLRCDAPGCESSSLVAERSTLRVKRAAWSLGWRFDRLPDGARIDYCPRCAVTRAAKEPGRV